MIYRNLNDIAQRKAELNAELKVYEKDMKQLKKALLSPPESKKPEKKGFWKFLPDFNIATAITAADSAWFVWKLVRKMKSK